METTILGRVIKTHKYAIPVHGPYQKYNPATADIISQSDLNFLKPIVRKLRENNGRNDYPDLKGKEYEFSFILHDCYIPVPDAVIKSKKKLDKFFKEKHSIILGPELGSDGEYSEHAESRSMPLDIFGKKIESVDYRFMPANDAGGGVFTRYFKIKLSEDYYDWITVLTDADFGFISRLIFKEKDDEIDSQIVALVQSEMDDESNSLVLVDDLDNEEDIKDAIENWLDKNKDELEVDNIEKVDILEAEGHIPLKNPLNFSLVLNN